MIRFSMPDQNGWYWVNHDSTDDLEDDESGDNWQMAYLDCEGVNEREITLTTFCPEIARAARITNPATVWVYRPEKKYHKWHDSEWLSSPEYSPASWSGPNVWIGPINVPGGPFGGPIVEPQLEDWLKAKRNGNDLKITAIFGVARKVVDCELRVETI